MKNKLAATLLAVAMVTSAFWGMTTVNSLAEETSEAITPELVDVNAGTLLGYKQDGVYNFKGIPYATAERFQSPVPVETYENGFQSALVYGTVSPQDRCLNGTGQINGMEFSTPSGTDMVANENCQYLNVWTSSLEGSKPVVVFMHGGGQNNGSSSELVYYEGADFAETQDCVFVSVNHRLNVLGYLDVSEYGGEEYKNSGLAAIEDLVCALQWVQDNIEQFGGDPSNVTIVGQSGGGAKVTTLACMPEAKELFNRVAVISGGYATESETTGKENTRLLVDYLGLEDDEVIETLTNMSYEELYAAATAAECKWNIYYGSDLFPTPIYDPETGVVNEYAAEREWIYGNTISEMNCNEYMITIGMFDGYILSDISDEEAMVYLEAKYGENAEAVAEAFKAAYPEYHTLAEAQFVNQRSSVLPEALANAGADVYEYVVAYKMPYFGGATMHHTADIPFWFNSIDTVEYQIDGDEENAHTVANTMSSALASFAADGNPSTDSLTWPAYTSDVHNTMVFDVTSKAKVDFDTELLQYAAINPYAEK